MTLQELSRLVALGEGQTLEFKTKVPRAERIAKEAIAFANTLGGRLLLGVEDGGTIKGVRDPDEEEFALRAALERHCDPPLSYTVEPVEVSKKRSVIVVTVPDSKAKPHFLVHHTNGAERTAYVRVEDMSVEASREAVSMMRAEKAPRDVVFEFGDKERVLMRYLDRYGQITVNQFARLVNIPRRKASRTLVLLARANVLRLHNDPRSDYFTLAYEPT